MLQLKVTKLGGGEKLINTSDGKYYNAEPGDKIELINSQADPSGLVKAGGDLLLLMDDGSFFVVSDFFNMPPTADIMPSFVVGQQAYYPPDFENQMDILFSEPLHLQLSAQDEFNFTNYESLEEDSLFEESTESLLFKKDDEGNMLSQALNLDEEGDIISETPTSEEGITISVNHVTVTEGEDAVFEVSLSAVSENPIVYNFLTANNSASGGGLDYHDHQGSITFAPGETIKNIIINTVDDLHIESHETFFLILIPESGELNSSISGIGTIIDNDSLPVFSINDVTVNEDAGTMVFTVTK
ncbi:MAG: Calx-beta domain-containing protein, partial [Flavobacteriaceae bacterium]